MKKTTHLKCITVYSILVREPPTFWKKQIHTIQRQELSMYLVSQVYTIWTWAFFRQLPATASGWQVWWEYSQYLFKCYSPQVAPFYTYGCLQDRKRSDIIWHNKNVIMLDALKVNKDGSSEILRHRAPHYKEAFTLDWIRFGTLIRYGPLHLYTREWELIYILILNFN